MPHPVMSEKRKQIYQAELLFRILVLLAATIAISMSFVMTVKDGQEVYIPFTIEPVPEVCGIRGILGVDCPGCGMSRAFISISNWEIDKALAYNSASLLVYVFVAVQIPWHAAQIFMTFYRAGPIDTWWTLLPPIGTIIWLLWCYWGNA